MENNYMRNKVTRTLNYTLVEVTCNGETQQYLVNGKTTKAKELKKLLSKFDGEIPTVEIKEVTEKRMMDLETFIELSIIVE